MTVEYFEENVELYNLTHPEGDEKAFRHALAYQIFTPYTESLDELNIIIPREASFTVSDIAAQVQIPFRWSPRYSRWTTTDGRYSTMQKIGRATLLAFALLDALRRKKKLEEAHAKFPSGTKAIGKVKIEGVTTEGEVKGPIEWSDELVYFIIADPSESDGIAYVAASVLELEPIKQEEV